MLNFSDRKHFTDEIVLVDGISRAGKFALAHVVAAFDRIEFIQYPYLLETLLYLHRLKKIDLETCRALLHMDFNMKIYDMIIGRGLNSREHDLSCIYKAANSESFIARSKEENREILVKKFQLEKRIPLFINHEGLANLSTMFQIYPSLKIINILRNPVALIESWYRRGMGNRIGNDPSMGWITFQHPKGATPWWATDWADEYHELSEMDRCVKNIATLQAMARAELDKASKSIRDRILFVEFEHLIHEPMPVVEKISTFLGRDPVPALDKILVRERMPRKIEVNENERILQAVKRQMSARFEPLLDSVVSEYNYFREKYI